VIESRIEPSPRLTRAQAGTDRRPEVTPKQDRSRANREALLDALMDLLYERPFADIGVADIARRAGMTTGAVYGRFGDKRGVAIALHERFAARASQTMEDWGARPQWATASQPENASARIAASARSLATNFIRGALIASLSRSVRASKISSCPSVASR